MWERWKAGWTLHQIGHLFDRPHTSIHTVLSRTGGIRYRWSDAAPKLRCPWVHGHKQFTMAAAAGHLTATFLGPLRELGLAQGRDFEIEYRWAAGETDK
jgi:hypothetical protein